MMFTSSMIRLIVVSIFMEQLMDKLIIIPTTILLQWNNDLTHGNKVFVPVRLKPPSVTKAKKINTKGANKHVDNFVTSVDLICSSVQSNFTLADDRNDWNSAGWKNKVLSLKYIDSQYFDITLERPLIYKEVMTRDFSAIENLCCKPNL